MSDITALEGRITFALDRIRAGVEKMTEAAASAPDGDDQTEVSAQVTTLTAALEEEKTANAQLQVRLDTLTARQSAAIAALEAQVAAQAEQMVALDAEIHSLRQAGMDLRNTAEQVRTAATAGVVDPALINAAMAAEIDALKAQRSAEAAEVTAILGTLKPMLKEA